MPTDPTPNPAPVERVDLDEVKPWLAQCGICDFGIGSPCVCPDGDYRPLMLRLVAEIEGWRALAAAGRLRSGPLLGVRTADGRIYDPRDVVLIYPGLPVPNPTTEGDHR